MRVADHRRRREQGRLRAGRKNARRPGIGNASPETKSFPPPKNPKKLPKSGTVRALSWIKPKALKSQNATRIKRTLRATNGAGKKWAAPESVERLRRRTHARFDASVLGATCAPARSARSRQAPHPKKTKRASANAPLGPLPTILVSNRGGCANASCVPSKKLEPRARRAQDWRDRPRNATLGKNSLKGKTA